MAESKSGLSVEEKEECRRIMNEVEEKEGTDGLHRFIVKKMMGTDEKETGGDDFLFWTEDNSIDSTQRINALDAKVCEFHGECGKLVVDWCVNNQFPKVQDALLIQLGLFTDECQVLHQEFAKSAAEFIIKKMRLGALVDKRDKKTTLMSEITTARDLWKGYGDVFKLFKKNLLLARRLEQDPHAAHVVDQENDVGGAARFESPETARGNEKLISPNIVQVFTIESFRVMVELMRGVKVGGQEPGVSGLDDAMALGKKWMEAEMDMCEMKVWVGIMVERRSVFEVLKREIALNWKMEKEAMDKIILYQKE